MLDEYIRLKEQKVVLDQEKCRLDLEKNRVQNLLNGMQHVMNAYNVSANLTLPTSIAAASSMPKTGHWSASKTTAVMSASMPSNTAPDTMKFSTPTSIPSTSKRKGFNDVPGAPITAKRSRKHFTTNQLLLKDPSSVPQSNSVDKQTDNVNSSVVQLSDAKTASDESPIQVSNVAKSLFNQSPPTNSSGPKTPPRASSSQTDKSISPLEACSTVTSSKNVTPSRITSTNCTIISSETIQVTPSKQIAFYSIERNHCISTSSPVKSNLSRTIRRDQVKSRLDFDASDDTPCNSGTASGSDKILTSESEKEVDFFDLDLPNFDALGVDFNLSELLVDFDLDGEGTNYSCQPTMDSSPDSFSGSPHESGNVISDANQMTSQISSTVTEVFSEQDMNLLGSDSLTTMKSVTKCIQILSPVKSVRSMTD